jgi:hypothetical protein
MAAATPESTGNAGTTARSRSYNYVRVTNPIQSRRPSPRRALRSMSPKPANSTRAIARSQSRPRCGA